MNCFVTASRRGSHGVHTRSSVINSAKALCAFKSVSPAAPGTSALLILPGLWLLSVSWSWPGSEGRHKKFFFSAQQGTAGTSVQEEFK